MDENREALEESLRQYETQLKQVTEALSGDGSSEELILLHENLQELITLTKESLESSKPEENNDDPLAEEYALFKAELENEISNENEESTEADDSLQDELNCLMGSKCRAPFSEKWSDDGSYSYHNALIMNIDSSDSLNNVQVKVLFVNPTCQEMVPCPYFLDGDCKFSDQQCRFSHGHDVNFADLKEYKEPDFSAIKEKLSVLAKDNDNVWKRATVTALILEDNQCCVRFDSGHKQDVVIDIHNTLPLENSEDTTEEKLKNKRFKKDDDFEEHQAKLVEKTLTEPAPPARLGEWEKYTNSIGSKLMASMGYIAGTGLGKHGEGRLEPVTATVLPPGKSLDHCMELREAAGGDPNLFNAEKLQKKIKRKMLANLRNKKARAASQEVQQSNDVFSFINKSLASSSLPKASSTRDDTLLKQSSTKALNVKELKICGDMQKKDYELVVLREKLSRQKCDTVGHNTLKKKIQVLESELNSMRSSLSDVYKEKNYRQTMRELTEF